MISFTQFIINFFNYFGLTYVFAAIFFIVIIYVIFYMLLSSIKRGDKSLFDEKSAKAISLLFAISSTIILLNIARIVNILEYFLSFVVFMVIIVLFLIVVLYLIYNKIVSPSEQRMRLVTIILIIFLIVFAFFSFALAYQDILYNMSAHPQQYPLASLFAQNMPPEILIIPFIFIFIGVAVMIVGR